MVSRTHRSMCVLALCVIAGACNVNRALEQVHEARHLAADLQIQFAKAADASNLTVMANTDEASSAFAREAESRTANAQKDIESLRPVLEGLGFTDEAHLLAEFAARFEAYRKLDRDILALAVENTNSKAEQLSYGAALSAGDALGRALEGLEPSTDSTEGWHVKALSASVVASAREIEALQAPHIAAPDDGTMTILEKRMTAAEQSARAALKELSTLVRPASKPGLATATTALDRLMDANRQILQLSRRNTNIRSLALALTEKPTAVAACEDRLHALQAALAKRGYGAQGRFPRTGSPSGTAP